jgi:molybdopterin converting factor small subunit
MQIRLAIQCAVLRKEIGWEQKSEDTIEITGDTIADFLKSIETASGKNLYDRYISGDSAVSVIWHNLTHFVKKDELDRKVNDGDKIVFLRRIPGGGG